MKTGTAGRTKDKQPLRLAIGMMGALVVTVAVMLSSLPGESAAKTCRMQISGPLAGTCAGR